MNKDKGRQLRRSLAEGQRPSGGITLLLWTDDGEHSRRLHLSRVALGLLLVIALAGAMAIGLLVNRTNQLTAQLEQQRQGSQIDAQREQSLHGVVGTQQQTLDHTRDELASERQKITALQAQLSELEQQLAELEQFSNQVRDLLSGQQPAASGSHEGGQLDAPQPQPSPTTQGYTLPPIPTNADDNGYRVTLASYRETIFAYQRRIADDHAALEELQAAIVDQTSQQQASDAKASTQSSLQAEAVAALKAQAARDAQAAYDAIPHGLPAIGELSSGFGWRVSPFDATKTGFHPGVDITVDTGTPVKATASGMVISASYETGFGRVIRIRHANGLVTLYGHNSRLLVGVGDKVQRGDLIAYSGNTGMSTGPHIHYGVYRDGIAVNPMRYR